jgi:hypothetical protein
MQLDPREYKQSGYALSHVPRPGSKPYSVKTLGTDELVTLLEKEGLASLPPDVVANWKTPQGDAARVCRVDFGALDHRHEPADAQQWFYRTLGEQFADNQVLAHYVPAPGSRTGNRSYIGVFQETHQSDEDRRLLRLARELRRRKHGVHD